MFYITETERAYILKIDRYIDEDEFKEFSSMFKSVYLFYSHPDKGWKITKSKGWETIQYLSKRFGINIDLKGIEVPKFANEPQETVFSRSSDWNPENIKVDLFEYQKEDVAWALKRSRGYIASDPGVGKTIESISIFSNLYATEKIDSVIILVKNNLTYHWEREIVEFSQVFSEQDIMTITNKNKRDFFEQPFATKSKIIICPNHLLSDVISSYSSFNLKKKWNKKSICLIADEAHEFKNSKAKRTKAMESILEYCDYRYFLSATPAINGFVDWYNQMRMLDKSIIPFSEKVFRLDIADYLGDKFDPFAVKQYNKQKVSEYIDRFRPWVIKRVKSDLPEVKSKQFVKPIYFEMSQKHQNIYNMIRNLYIEKIKEVDGKITFAEIQNKFPYLCLAIDNPSLLKDRIKEEDQAIFRPLENQLSTWKLEDNIKIQYLDEFLRDKIKYEKEKVIVFDTHPKTLDEMFERYSEYNPLMIHGQTKDSMEERQKKVDLFNDKTSNNKLFLLNVQTGGTGLNLQKACNTTVFFSMPFDATLYRQALDRTYRVTSERDSFVELLVYGKSIDEQKVKRNLNRTEFNDNFLKEEAIILI